MPSEPAIPSVGDLFDRFRERVYGAAFAVTLDHADAEDATQETFVKVLSRLQPDLAGRPSGRPSGAFEGRSDVGTWLYRIAVNAARDRVRRRAAERARIERAAERDAPSARPARAIVEDPAVIAERHDEVARLKAALALLSADQREVFGLREVGGLSTAEIAETLGVSEGKVRVDLHRARRKLRDALEPDRPNRNEGDASSPTRPARRRS